MFLQKNAPWSIQSDFPEALQCCAYLGEQRGFALGGEAQLDVEQAWREWWNVCSRITLARLSDAYEREHPGGGEALQYIGNHYRQIYDPPSFDTLSNQELQAISCELWPAFQEFWGRSDSAKSHYTQRLSTQSKRIDFNKLVGAVMREIGKREGVRLMLDFVYWPDDYRAQLAPDHILLGARYLEPMHQIDLEAIVRDAVRAQLVL